MTPPALARISGITRMSRSPRMSSAGRAGAVGGFGNDARLYLPRIGRGDLTLDGGRNEQLCRQPQQLVGRDGAAVREAAHGPSRALVEDEPVHLKPVGVVDGGPGVRDTHDTEAEVAEGKCGAAARVAESLDDASSAGRIDADAFGSLLHHHGDA